MRNLILATMAGVILTQSAAWGSDDPMAECVQRLNPVQQQIQEQKKLAEQLDAQADEVSRKEQAEISEKARQEGPHDYRTRLVRSWMNIEADFDRFEKQQKDIHEGLEGITAWAIENQSPECIKKTQDEHQAVQEVAQKTNETIDKMRESFIRRLEESKGMKAEPPQQTKRGAEWVLWTHSSALSYRTGTKENWDTTASFGNKDDCLEGSQKKLKEIEKDGFKSQRGYNTAFKESKDGVVLTVQYVCLPDNEDPRVKKGKEK